MRFAEDLAFPELRILGLRAFVQGIHNADLTKRARDNLIATCLVIVEKEFDDSDNEIETNIQIEI